MSDYYAAADDVLPLFRPPAVASSATSVAAADSLTVDDLTAMQRRVLRFLETCGAFGATDEECQLALGMNPSTQRPRRVELARKCLIVEAGIRRTTSGRNASVWRITAASRDGREAKDGTQAR